MIPRIREIFALSDYILKVTFDDGKTVFYDVKDDIQAIPSYRALTEVKGLFKNVHLDESRTVVFWTDDIDLPSDSIYEYGIVAKENCETVTKYQS